MALLEGVHYIYTVKPGDTLYEIANRYGSTVQLLEQTNALFDPVTDPGLIHPGQVLVISETGLGQRSAVSYMINAGDSLYTIGKRFSAIPDLLVGLNPLITDADVIYAGTPMAVPAFIYEVESGDSLYRIGQKLGVPMKEIIQANRNRPGFSPDVLYIGYRLIVPMPSSNNIVVFRPQPGARITPGQALEGIARAFEATILYQVVDDNGVVVTREKHLTTSAGAPEYGSFSAAILFDRQPTADGGEVWVYARSAMDGRIIDLVQVKVGF
ncbi:LysM peptidoglycan-binding domain-containing protein [Paenibacillus arenilitoris]|uniref:LysM peptidoglycan-binding domain-containing protein n=1 Tax=Paenibacillus arenilitoris TaxID=2772299 RepID=A0A927CQE0_9BACL|nr:LysM peptidoglycan-binding domain-containing protein [Paenibacillus arenilitoris]MBD2870893.1 LysM peptidoglycan-binding domain-containing protein [Paenibacillus arenilitoris]